MTRIILAAGLLLLGCSSSAPPGSVDPAPDLPPGVLAEPEVVVTSEGRGREIEYEAGPATRYRVDRFDTVTVHMPDGSQQQQAFARSAWLSVLTAGRDDSDSLSAEIVLDSLAVSGMVAVPAASLDSAKGTRWTATIAPNGRLVNPTADRSSAGGDQVGSLLQLLFPLLPGESIRAGARWTDTTDMPTKVDAFDVQEQAVSQHAAFEPSVRGDGTVLPIQTTATFSRQGTATQGGQSMQMEATGSRRFTQYLALDGVPAGLEGSETIDMTITVPAVGQSLQAEQSGTIRITPVTGR